MKRLIVALVMFTVSTSPAMADDARSVLVEKTFDTQELTKDELVTGVCYFSRLTLSGNVDPVLETGSGGIYKTEGSYMVLYIAPARDGVKISITVFVIAFKSVDVMQELEDTASQLVDAFYDGGRKVAIAKRG